MSGPLVSDVIFCVDLQEKPNDVKRSKERKPMSPSPLSRPPSQPLSQSLPGFPPGSLPPPGSQHLPGPSRPLPPPNGVKSVHTNNVHNENVPLTSATAPSRLGSVSPPTDRPSNAPMNGIRVSWPSSRTSRYRSGGRSPGLGRSGKGGGGRKLPGLRPSQLGRGLSEPYGILRPSQYVRGWGSQKPDDISHSSEFTYLE